MRTLTSLALIVLSLPATLGAATPDPETVLDTLRKDHPRLMLTPERLAELKARRATDPVLDRLIKDALAAADKAMRKAPLKHRKRGPRLLHVSRDCLDRTYALALAWRLTGQDRYATAARDNLVTVCAFKDWNPSHFLDTAEMSHAVGIGYDWLYDKLDEPTRAKIRAGLIRLGLEPGLKVYRKGGWWSLSAFNWNQVCNGGLVAGALAIAETDPEYARRIVPAAAASLPKALATYAPDGAWGEGPGYWHYATRYTCYALAAMETALGTDFDLSASKGLAESGLFPVLTSGPGPRHYFLNFADSGERARRRPMACLFYLARKYRRPVFAAAEHDMLAGSRARPGHVIWYVPRPKAKVSDLPLDGQFRGPVETAVFRTAWGDPNATFLGVKAGYNQVNHGHLDLGSFEFDALGVRWARDLGSDNYNLPGYWDKRPGGRRWTYYRLNSASHNVPLLDGKDQNALGKARIVKFASTPQRGLAVIDLTGAYTPLARSVRRGAALIRDRKAVLVQDELDLAAPRRIEWGMTTDADVAVATAGEALLTLKGKRLRATVLSPAGATFSVASAEQKPPQRTNRGVRRLLVRVDAPAGEVTVAVLFEPLVKE
ncbi:MAG: heparinase II/III domain-containing protein, partial [Planctomycetota bacterium]